MFSRQLSSVSPTMPLIRSMFTLAKLASVIHSHDYPPIQLFQRSFDEWRALAEVRGMAAEGRPLRLALERLIFVCSGLAVACIAYAGVLSVIRSSGTRTSVLDIPFWLFASPMLVGFGAAAVGYLYFALRRQGPPVDGAQPII